MIGHYTIRINANFVFLGCDFDLIDYFFGLIRLRKNAYTPLATYRYEKPAGASISRRMQSNIFSAKGHGDETPL